MRSHSPVWLHRYASFTAIATLFLLAAGALVTGTGSGLAVPDWPLSFGQFFPPMVGGVLFEHGHRMVAGFVAILTAVLAILVYFYEPRQWVRRMGYAALGAVLLQACLGGMTVLLKLPKPVSISHACLAQIYFCLVSSIALVTSPYWTTPKRALQGAGVRSAAAILVVFFFLQLVLGATVRHLKAGLAIPDFPTAFGGFLPPSFTLEIGIHFAHRVGALVVTLFAAVVAIWILTRHAEHLDLVAVAGLLLLGLSIQVMLGAVIIWARRPIPITTLHLVNGAFCFAASVWMALVAFRHPAEERKSVITFALQGEPA